MTVEEVYTDAFDNTYVDWTEVGASPYLDDSSDNYIYTNISDQLEGNWTFPASAGSGTINSVKLELEMNTLYGDSTGNVTVYVWDGTSWVDAGNIYGDMTTYTWKELDVSSILNTWAKINGAKVYVESAILTPKDPDTIYLRRLTRKVDYTVGIASKRLLVGVGL